MLCAAYVFACLYYMCLVCLRTCVACAVPRICMCMCALLFARQCRWTGEKYDGIRACWNNFSKIMYVALVVPIKCVPV